AVLLLDAVVHEVGQDEARARPREDMMTRILHALVVVLLLMSGAACAVESGDLRLVPAPVNRLDDGSLQRGARNFVNYCLNCHSARYMRYNRLIDLGIETSMIADNLMFATDK